MMQQLDKNLWIASQPLRYMGVLPVGTRMSVVQLSNQSVAIISPIALNEEIRKQISSIGQVEHIIAPNLYHYFYAAEWKVTFPTATLWATKGMKEKQPELPIDQNIQEESLLWNELSKQFFDGLRTLSFGGGEALNEWVFFHAASRTLILTDAAFHFEDSFPLVNQLAARVLGCYGQLRPSWFEKIAVKDESALRQSVKNVLKWDFERVIMAHGRVIERDGKAMLNRGYEQFFGELIGNTEEQ